MAELGTIVALIKSMSGADPAVIEQAVTDWLDDHPEATTTVQDGSITEAKLAQDVLAELGEIEGLKEAIVPLTPAATSGDVGKFLKAKTVSGGKVTEYEFGEGGGGSVTVDDELSDSSTNPVQNKVITGAIAPLTPSATSGDVGKFLKAKTVSGGKVTEYEFGEASGGALSNDIKEALLACFENVAWAGNDGYDYYSALYEALYGVPPTPPTPTNYTYYDWLQGDSHAFIDTGLDAQTYGADTYEKEIKFVMTSFSRSQGIYPYVYGVTNNFGVSGFYVCGETSSSDKTIYVLTNKQYTNTTFQISSRDELVTIKTKGYETYYNGTLIYTGTDATQAILSSMNIMLFTLANGGGGDISYDGYYVENPAPCKIYEFTVKDNQGNTVAHMVPAKRNSDNAIGMYDTVRDEFFVNAASSGSFTIGNDE